MANNDYATLKAFLIIDFIACAVSAIFCYATVHEDDLKIKLTLTNKEAKMICGSRSEAGNYDLIVHKLFFKPPLLSDEYEANVTCETFLGIRSITKSVVEYPNIVVKAAQTSGNKELLQNLYQINGHNVNLALSEKYTNTFPFFDKNKVENIWFSHNNSPEVYLSSLGTTKFPECKSVLLNKINANGEDEDINIIHGYAFVIFNEDVIDKYKYDFNSIDKALMCSINCISHHLTNRKKIASTWLNK